MHEIELLGSDPKKQQQSGPEQKVAVLSTANSHDREIYSYSMQQLC